MEFGVLGPLQAGAGDHRYSLGGPKQRAVLALLISAAGRAVSVDALIDGIYGDQATDRAHRSIHTFVSNLRAELGDVLERSGDGYVFLGGRSTVDAFRFEDAVEQASALDDPSAVAKQLKNALAMWRGHAYADVDARTALSAEITRLGELRVTATERRIDAELAAGRHAALVAELEALTVEHPFRESFLAQQMIALYRSGRQAEALRAYAKARETLVEQMGLEPSPRLRELESKILDHDSSLLLDVGPTIRRAAVLVADIDDPSKLSRLDPSQREKLVADQDQIFVAAVHANQGEVFAHRGSAIYAIFDDAGSSMRCAVTAQRDLGARDLAMRMAVDLGDVEVHRGGSVRGPSINRAAAMAGSAHSGQILLSAKVQAALGHSRASDWALMSLGEHEFSGIAEPIAVHQVVVPDLPGVFPELHLGALPPAVPGAASGLPGYELREQIGSGVFGTVHRAYQPSVGREVAIKIIHPEFANHPEFIRRFEVEAQLVARLEHPHLIPLYDYWRGPDGAYLAMRWIRGGSLASRLARRPLDVQYVSGVLTQIAGAVAYAHRNGVVHRDIKPANVLMDDDGNAYLTDFGIARGATGPSDRSTDVIALGHLIGQCLADQDLPERIDLFLADVHSNRFVDIEALLEGWSTATGDTDNAATIGFTETRNPYKGLRAFGEVDSADFYGRADETIELLNALATGNLVAVVGPSGIGKSSVVRAGLLPALRSGQSPGSEQWLITDMTPGANPFAALATALHRLATDATIDIEQELRDSRQGLIHAVRRAMSGDLHLVIVIDQFEELFTLVRDEAEQREFVELLLAALTEEQFGISIVLTMRADFFDRPLRFGEFGDLLRSTTVPISAPTEDDLRSIVVEPASSVGVSFDPQLVERLVADVKDQAGALPLLEFALTELFERRDSDQLKAHSYESEGGVRGALGRRAEAVLGSLEKPVQDVARQVFLRLLRLPDAERVTRRRVRQAELGRLGETTEDVQAVLDAFASNRLLVGDRDPATHGPTFEVAHEALFTEWDRLKGWIEERRSDLRARQRLLEAAEEWEDSGRHEAMLLTGSRLGQLEAFIESTDLKLGAAELAVIEASVARRDVEARQRRTLRRRVLAGFAAAAVVASVLALVATSQRSRAEQARTSAQASVLAAHATNRIETDPEQGVLLALESVKLAKASGADPVEATSALRKTLAAHRIKQRFAAGGFVDVSSDGERIVMGTDDGGIVMRDVVSGDLLATTGLEGLEVLDADFSPAGDMVAVTFLGERVEIWTWDPANSELSQLEDPHNNAWVRPLASFSDSGDYLTAGWNDSVHVWSTASGDLVQTIRGIDVVDDGSAFLSDSVFLPGSTDVVIADIESLMVHRHDALTGERTSASLPVEVEPVYADVSADGSTIVVTSGDDQAVVAYDLDSGARLWRTTLDRPGGIEWVPDRSAVAIGSDGGRVALLDFATGAVIETLDGGHVGSVREMAAVPGTGLLATSGESDGTTLLSDVTAGPVAEISKFVGGAEQLRRVLFAPYPDQVFVSDNANNTAKIMDADTGEVLLEFTNPQIGVAGGFETAAFGGGSVVTYLGIDDTSSVIDSRTGAELLTLEQGLMARLASYDGSIVLVHPIPWAELPRQLFQVRDVRTGAVISNLAYACRSVSWFSYDGRWLSDWGAMEVRVCETDTGRLAFSVEAMAVHPLVDGETVAIVDHEGTLHVAELDALLAGESIEDAQLWSGFTTRGLVVPPGIASSSDGAYIGVVARNSEPARVWDADSGQIIAELDSELLNGVPEIFFHPDVPHVTLASEGGILLTYTLDVDELVAIAESRVTRSLTVAECQALVDPDACPIDE